LALGIAYPPSPGNGTLPGEGRIASYAWGDDYHEVLPPRLQAVVSFIESRLGTNISNRWYTDTGPILEREMAQRAGLGWIGKNTCLINPQAGSYFLLAEILLGIELEPDPPFVGDLCGSCNRCIQACPTGCILPNRTINANRCISYLTIEEKQALPYDLRSKIGNWVFGCDVCQQVCPWNLRFASPAEEPRFCSLSGGPTRPILEDLGLTPHDFNQVFKTSPIKRTKRRGYLRNVSIAIGNAGIPEGVPALKHLLFDAEPLIRSHAAWALGQIGDFHANQALQQALRSETDSNVRIDIQFALTNP
jgi:epoxyqueuosine reductase